MKFSDHLLDNLEAESQAALYNLLSGVTTIVLVRAAEQLDGSGLANLRPDFIFETRIAGKTWTLIGEILHILGPRQAREQVVLFKASLQDSNIKNPYPILIAPWISPEVVAICTEAGIGTLDLTGNCHITFGTVFIERSGHPAPPAQRREARALFAPKSARVLRVLLRNPNQAWKTEDLASTAQVSLGHVSNTRQELLEREFAAKVTGGLKLVQPQKLLEAWRQEYKSSRVLRQNFYTLLHGEALDLAITQALETAGQGAHALMAASTAARWLAPYLRTSSQYFHADQLGLDVFKKALQLQPVLRGENIVLTLEPDEGIFLDRFEAAPGIWTTGLVQTYLDLAVSGERGLEAAQHLLETRILPAWKEPA